MTGLLSSIVFFLLVSGNAAFAQPAGPHDIAPPLDAEEDTINSDDIPSPSVDTLPKIETDRINPNQAISSAPVAKPSAEGFGTLDAKTGGLSASVWKGSARESAEALLEAIHSGVVNDALSQLVVRLLMTQATPPEGKPGQDWLVLRLNALVALGQDDKAWQMITALPASLTSDAVRQLKAQLLLLRGDVDGACQLSGSEAPFWQKMHVLCQSHAGKHDEAMLGLEVLREQNQLNDPFFQEAMHKLGDKAAAIKTLPKKWSLFDAALLMLTGEVDKAKDRFEALPPIALKYIAKDSALDMKLREKATAKAQAAGILTREGSKPADQPFAKTLASDVTSLVRALESGKPAGEADNQVIARLAIEDGTPIQDTRRIQRLLTLMEPFGYKVPAAVWEKLLSRKSRFDGEVPPAALVSRLNEAMQADRKGEVIVLSALIIDAGDLDKASELELLPVVRALKIAGFEKEARSIAVTAVKSYK